MILAALGIRATDVVIVALLLPLALFDIGLISLLRLMLRR